MHDEWCVGSRWEESCGLAPAGIKSDFQLDQPWEVNEDFPEVDLLCFAECKVGHLREGGG